MKKSKLEEGVQNRKRSVGCNRSEMAIKHPGKDAA